MLWGFASICQLVCRAWIFSRLLHEVWSSKVAWKKCGHIWGGSCPFTLVFLFAALHLLHHRPALREVRQSPNWLSLTPHLFFRKTHLDIFSFDFFFKALESVHLAQWGCKDRPVPTFCFSSLMFQGTCSCSAEDVSVDCARGDWMCRGLS